MSVAALPFVPVFLDAFSRLSFWNNSPQQQQQQQPQQHAQQQQQQQQQQSQLKGSQSSLSGGPRQGRRGSRSCAFVCYMPPRLIDFAVCTMESVLEGSCKPSPASAQIPSLHSFISGVVKRTPVNAFTLAVAMIYIGRFKAHLSPASVGSHDTRHRLFMVSLMLASKFLNDQSLTNKAWAKASGLFSLSEISMMEMDFLTVLRFDLFVDRASVNYFLEQNVMPMDDETCAMLNGLTENVILQVEVFE